MKTSLHELQQKLSELRETGVFTESEFHYIRDRIGGYTIPWLSIISLISGCLGLILLDANISLTDELFTISDGAAISGIITGILAVNNQESNRFIAVIGILLSLFVLLTIHILVN